MQGPIGALAGHSSPSRVLNGRSHPPEGVMRQAHACHLLSPWSPASRTISPVYRGTLSSPSTHCP